MLLFVLFCNMFVLKLTNIVNEKNTNKIAVVERMQGISLKLTAKIRS